MIVPFFSVLVLEIHIQVRICLHIVWSIVVTPLQVIVVIKLVGLFVGILIVVMSCKVMMVPVTILLSYNFMSVRMMSVDGVEGLVVGGDHFSSVVERETEVILEVDRFDGDDLLFNDYIVLVGWLGMMMMRVSLFIVMVLDNFVFMTMAMVYCSVVAVLVRGLLKMVDWAFVGLLHHFMSVLMVNWFNHLFVLIMHWCNVLNLMNNWSDILYFVVGRSDVLNLMGRCDILDFVANVMMFNWVLSHLMMMTMANLHLFVLLVAIVVEQFMLKFVLIAVVILS